MLPYSYWYWSPNLIFIHGPDGSDHSGSLPHSVEKQNTDVAGVLRDFSGEGIRTIVPTNVAADDLVEYFDTFFPNTCLVKDVVPGLIRVSSLTDIPARPVGHRERLALRRTGSFDI
jgi:hypothetical protein